MNAPLASGRKPLAPQGMTVVELMVVMFIMAMITGLGAYAMGMIGGSDIRNDTVRMNSVIKYTYSNASINNTRYRLVFEVGTGNYYTEVTDEPVVAIDDTVEDQELLTEEARELAAQREKETDLFDDEESNPFGINRKVSFQRVNDVVIKKTGLSDGVIIDKVYSPRFPDGPITEGRASMSFFPNGYQEQVLIIIKDDAGKAYSILTEPFTGKIKIFSEEIEPPEGFGEAEEDDG